MEYEDVTYFARFSERINCDEDSRCFKHYEPQLSYSEEADEDVRIDVMKKLAQLHSMEFPEADAAGYKEFIYDEQSWWNTYDVEAHFNTLMWSIDNDVYGSGMGMTDVLDDIDMVGLGMKIGPKKMFNS